MATIIPEVAEYDGDKSAIWRRISSEAERIYKQIGKKLMRRGR